MNIAEAPAKFLAADLFSDHPILFDQIVDNVMLMLVNPSGDGSNEE